MENWKYMPEVMRVVHRCQSTPSLGGVVPVVRYEMHQKRAGFTCPVVLRIAACGCIRTTGVKDARINSELRMIIIPISDRDEVIRGWEDCTEIF